MRVGEIKLKKKERELGRERESEGEREREREDVRVIKREREGEKGIEREKKIKNNGLINQNYFMIILSSLSQICESSSLKNLMCGIRARIYDHMIVHTHTHLYFPS